MHGYELRKRLNLMLGWGRVLSYGSLYPTLKKMLRGALIEESTASTRPSLAGPKIVYQVTEAGTREFERLMAEVGPTAWEDDNFDIRFAFFSSTDMEIRLRVLEGRRTRLQERLDRVQRELAMTAAGGRPVRRRAPAPRCRVGRSARSTGSPTSSTPSAATPAPPPATSLSARS